MAEKIQYEAVDLPLLGVSVSEVRAEGSRTGSPWPESVLFPGESVRRAF
jgi:hypothetical protein